jgi:hypothetical protein
MPLEDSLDTDEDERERNAFGAADDEDGDRLLDAFGRLLMRRVRDPAIRDWDGILDGRMRDMRSRWLQRRLELLTTEQRAVLRDLIPEIVDTTLHYLLYALEDEDSVSVGKRAGGAAVADIRQVAAGDLQGYLYEWAPRFSAERHGEPDSGPAVAVARYAVLGLPDVLVRRVADDLRGHLADLEGVRDPQVEWDATAQRLLVRVGIAECARRVWGDGPFAEFVLEHVLDTATGRPKPGIRVELLDIIPAPEPSSQ